MSAPAITRYETERTFFDNKAKAQKAQRINADVVKRYASPGQGFPLEMMFRLAGDLRGKTVLDVGCGDGLNAVVLGLLGARVTGIDISPGAIRLAEDRCEVNGVVAEFICSPLEEIADLGRRFDIVWVDALLHHMLHDFPGTLSLLNRVLAPGGKVLMKEPIALSPTFRWLRLKFGPAPDATPDERPLDKVDINLIRRQFPGLQEHRYYLLNRFGGERTRKFLSILDAALVRVPLVKNLASVVVLST